MPIRPSIEGRHESRICSTCDQEDALNQGVKAPSINLFAAGLNRGRPRRQLTNGKMKSGSFTPSRQLALQNEGKNAHL